jgi:hypothetical protein
VFSFAGGVGTVAVSETTDSTVRGARGVTALVSVPPLAAIPRIETEADRRRRRWRRAIAIGSVAGVVGGAVALVHFFYMPLDVLWYAMQRRLGIQ